MGDEITSRNGFIVNKNGLIGRPAEKGILMELLGEKATIYLTGIVEGKDGMAYQVINRESGILEANILGEIVEVKCEYTVFEDPRIENLWDEFNYGRIDDETLRRLGGYRGFNPMPQGQYLGRIAGVLSTILAEGPPSNSGFQVLAKNYDMASDQFTNGNEHMLMVYLKDAPTQRIRTKILDHQVEG